MTEEAFGWETLNHCGGKKDDRDILTAQLSLEQLQHRDQLLSAQNEMLKILDEGRSKVRKSFTPLTMQLALQRIIPHKNQHTVVILMPQTSWFKRLRSFSHWTLYGIDAKDKEIQYTSNQAMAQIGVHNYTEESDQAYKRRKTGKS
ncbi:hypothetical protein REPUB_Repub17cG0166400 [Reevesia pubescens]